RFSSSLGFFGRLTFRLFALTKLDSYSRVDPQATPLSDPPSRRTTERCLLAQSRLAIETRWPDRPCDHGVNAYPRLKPYAHLRFDDAQVIDGMRGYLTSDHRARQRLGPGAAQLAAIDADDETMRGLFKERGAELLASDQM